MLNKNCIFCKIVSGQAPCYKIYENDNFFVFLSINPISVGHSLIIPKKHYRWVWDYPDLGEYFNIVKKILKAIKKAFNTKLVYELVAGDEIHHAHVSLFPDINLDKENGLNLGKFKKFSEKEMQKIAQNIKSEIE
jgi:histidine triad (HIT) family protein